MESRQALHSVYIDSDEATFMTLEIDAARHNIQIKWLRPVNCEECVRAVQIASRVAGVLREMRNQNYTLVQE